VPDPLYCSASVHHDFDYIYKPAPASLLNLKLAVGFFGKSRAEFSAAAVVAQQRVMKRAETAHLLTRF